MVLSYLNIVMQECVRVREYWIVDPVKNRIMVYNFGNKTKMEEYTFADKVKVGIYEDLEIDFSTIEL